LDEVRELIRSEAASDREQMDRFKDGGLAFAILPKEQIEARPKLIKLFTAVAKRVQEEL